MISEVAKNTLDRVSAIDAKVGSGKSFDPDARIDIKSIPEYNPDRRVDAVLNREIIYTSESIRIKFAGHSDGKWKGEIGNSTFVPSSPDANKALKDYKQEGVDYKDGNPDFSKCSIETIQIDGMSSRRERNFATADKEISERWSAEGKFGKTDWTRIDVRNWRHENRYSWHERIDKKTMDLVQRDIHEACKHFGGVAECKLMERAGGLFDV